MGGPLKLKFVNNFIIYQKRLLRGHLGLAGYTQSSGTGELSFEHFLDSTFFDLFEFSFFFIFGLVLVIIAFFLF